MLGECVKDFPAGSHFRTERGENAPWIIVDRVGRSAFSGNSTGAQGVRDALATPRLQETGGVAGYQHRASSQRRIGSAATGQMSGIANRRYAGEPEPLKEI